MLYFIRIILPLPPHQIKNYNWHLAIIQSGFWISIGPSACCKVSLHCPFTFCTLRCMDKLWLLWWRPVEEWDGFTLQIWEALMTTYVKFPKGSSVSPNQASCCGSSERDDRPQSPRNRTPSGREGDLNWFCALRVGIPWKAPWEGLTFTSERYEYICLSFPC